MLVRVRVRVGCQFDHQALSTVPSLWQVRPRRDGAHRLLSQSWQAPGPVHSYLDFYGNECDRLQLPPGASTVRYDAVAELAEGPDETDESAQAAAIEDLPDDAVVYLLPSRFCWPEVLYEAAWDLFGEVNAGWERAQAVCQWVHDNITYAVGASNPLTTAWDIWESRTGVCRDYTQLGIALCRALNMPARYIAGYLPDIDVEPSPLPMDFCSWYEVWLGDRWWTFDPRNNQRRVGRVIIARGRDALDAAMVTTWGAADLQVMSVWADEVTDVF